MVQGIRQKLAQEGRDPYSVKIYVLLSIVTDETDVKAQAKFKEYQSYGSYDGALTLLSGWSGVDFHNINQRTKLNIFKLTRFNLY